MCWPVEGISGVQEQNIYFNYVVRVDFAVGTVHPDHCILHGLSDYDLEDQHYDVNILAVETGSSCEVKLSQRYLKLLESERASNLLQNGPDLAVSQTTMSFLKDIHTFSKSGLRPTATEVTFIDGRRVKETRDSTGSSSSEVIDSGLGFVGDYKPDLQMALVTSHLYLGSQDVAADLKLLHTHSITHILNAVAQLPNSFPALFTYHNLDILDLPETNICDYFPEAFRFIDQARKKGNVFVHCNAGVSRAASIVIGYLMRTEGIGYQEAYGIVKSVRASVRPNDGFRQQLMRYKPCG